MKPQRYKVTGPLRDPEQPDVLSVDLVVQVRAPSLVEALTLAYEACPEMPIEKASVLAGSSVAGCNAVAAAARTVRDLYGACVDCGLVFPRDELMGGVCADCVDA